MSLVASNINVSLSGKRILKDISVEFQSGKLIGLVGPNGAGKSTLIRVLAGLQMVTSGEIHLDKQPLQSLERLDLAKKITYLPQTGECHWPMTVERVVMLGRHPHIDNHRLDSVNMQAVEQAIKDADIEHLVSRAVNELSGGERARVMLARALATQSDILLADEPIASLDPRHQIEVMALLQALAHKGKSVIVVLHELHLAMRYCDNLVLIDTGEKISEGAPHDVLTPENLHDVYGIDAIFGDHQGDHWVLPWEIKKGKKN
ncbi:MAG: cobalamin/Fe3+-siderophore ABC transporter ATP-binding protein [Cycloclasticus sp. symbiont of Bathymodiolus heckerae]|nr:MAG: cobalamin/Fe3+-siderophore ABC transporter ATP-binding protein [Cycloclasticus sp. symbiont of Bathymodiolus heckerae]